MAIVPRNPLIRLKVGIRDLLLQVVYDPPQQKLQSELDALILKNMTFVGSSTPCFSFRGQTRVYSMTSGSIPAVIPRVSKELLPQVEAWHIEKTELDEEQRIAAGSITAVLNVASESKDYLQVFPECLHSKLEEFFLALDMNGSVPSKPLSNEQMEALKTQQRPYLALLQGRMMRNLIDGI